MTTSAKKLNVSALIVTRSSPNGELEILNVLAHGKSKYGFPGGKLEEGETPLQAVHRETEEELGATPTNVNYLQTSKALTPEGLEIEMHIFGGTVHDEIEPRHEIKELHWLTYEQMAANLDLLTPMTIEHVLPLLRNKV